MDAGAIEEVENAVENCTDGYSLGFTRYTYLPERVQRAMHLARLLIDGDTQAHKAIKEFLGGLSKKEFNLWMQIQ